MMNDDAATTVKEMLRHDGEVQIARCSEACLRLMREHKAPLVVLELSSRMAVEAKRVMRAVRSGFPLVVTAGFATWNQDAASAIIPLAKEGLNHVVFDDVDGAATLRRIAKIAGLLGARDADVVWTGIASHVPSPLADHVRTGLRVVLTCRSADEMAARLRTYRQKLDASVQVAGGPSIGRFRHWCRCFWVGFYLDRSSLSVEAIAFQLGFGSSSTLSHLVKDYVHLTPGELRKRGALESLAAVFAAECANGPKSSRRNGRSVLVVGTQE